MKKILSFAAMSAIVAGFVFVACKKEAAKVDETKIKQDVKQRESEIVVPSNPPSTLFTSTNGPNGPFYDEYGNHVEMAPIYI